jgi:hypothetical protein
MSLQQLNRQVSYLTHELQQGSGGSGIETINDITPDAAHNFQLYEGSNIILDPSGNGLTISTDIIQTISETPLFCDSVLLTQASYGIYDASSQLFLAFQVSVYPNVPEF